jgi:uncharacterized membrane protein
MRCGNHIGTGVDMWIAITLHILAAVVWVGGMFFAYLALRPAAAGLEPAQRLALWSRTFKRFFAWVWAAVIVLPVTGYWMIVAVFDGFANVGVYVHIMQALGILMILIYLHVFFAPYQRLNRALAASDLATASKHLNQIRILVAANLALGLITIIVASAGAYWS